MLVDTHCHIHSTDFKLDADEVIKNAQLAGVDRLICVGTDLSDSRLAVKFVDQRPGLWASIGIHPHETEREQKILTQLETLVSPKIVAVGEIGLDYYYNHSPKDVQIQALKFQIELALSRNLPIIFHVREATADFVEIIKQYSGSEIRGVIHSFSAGRRDLDQFLELGFYIGLNGIMTFSKNQEQLESAKAVPLERIMLETDAPFLTPHPHRGTINECKHIATIAHFLSDLREESIELLADHSTRNAEQLFAIA